MKHSTRTRRTKRAFLDDHWSLHCTCQVRPLAEKLDAKEVRQAEKRHLAEVAADVVAGGGGT